MRGSSPPGGIDDDDESGQEDKAEKKAKPRKKVRWGDEIGSSNDGSETKSANPTVDRERTASSEISRKETETKSESDGSDLSGISRLETQVECRGFASSELSRVQTKNENEVHENAGMARVETQGSSTSSAESEKKKKEKTRIDDKDNGAVGFLGMDVERLAMFPYF